METNWRNFFPLKEKAVLFTWMLFPLLVISVIYISFSNGYSSNIRIYNIVTAPMYVAVVILLLVVLVKTRSKKKRHGAFYSKPIAWVLNLTLWGTVVGRLIMITLKVFCYINHSCHHPLMDAENLMELGGGMLDDLTDIAVLLALYTFVQHFLLHDIIRPSPYLRVVKHLILGVLVLLFFQIASQELHELITERKELEKEESEGLQQVVKDESQIELSIDFVAPFTFLLSTELIGLLIGLALVLDVSGEESPSLPESQRKRSRAVTNPFSPVSSLYSIEEDSGISHDTTAESSADDTPQLHRSRSEPQLHEAPIAVVETAKKTRIPLGRVFKFNRGMYQEHSNFRIFTSGLVIFLSVTLLGGQVCEMAHKTFLYGRFQTDQIKANSSGNDSVILIYMGPDRQVSDYFNIVTNLWSAVLFVVLMLKILDGIKHKDYVLLAENHHSKIDKLFLFFTATLWSIGIAIYATANFYHNQQHDPHHRYLLSEQQRWTGLFSQISMFCGMWLQLMLLQIQLSIALPRRVGKGSKLHHWAHIIALHSILALDLVEWFSFFFDQQFTKHLLPFYPSSLLIPTRLLTPYVGMYLFHAICCWMIVRNNFKKHSYFNIGTLESVA